MIVNIVLCGFRIDISTLVKIMTWQWICDNHSTRCLMTSSDYLTHLRIPYISVDVITQDCVNFVAYALELTPSCAEPSIYGIGLHHRAPLIQSSNVMMKTTNINALYWINRLKKYTKTYLCKVMHHGMHTTIDLWCSWTKILMSHNGIVAEF